MVFAVASPETTPLFPLVRLQLSGFRRVMCRADFSIRDPDGPTSMCASLLLDTLVIRALCRRRRGSGHDSEETSSIHRVPKVSWARNVIGRYTAEECSLAIIKARQVPRSENAPGSA